ncbi:molybdopterin-dependent oxidoreductase [Photobacterium minamisatsumaniensis]|uniref:molybdopterin-dependent oxidoreductase n=1 Tax=Photobacterium minamisatsumaniensis TaxID=2910233 RepID=UPI003D1293AD
MSDSTDKWIKTTCAYCGVGCGIEAKPNAQGTLDIRGDTEHPANYGKLCTKGLTLGETVGHQGRLLTPSIHGESCQWDQALDYVAEQFNQVIEQHGRQAVAFYVSGQLLTEDYYVANKLMKGFIGSSNIDTNSRLCMSSSVAGHKRAFGADIVPGCYEDIEQAELVILTGSNLAWCHPVLFQRLKAAKAKQNTKVVVIDPRKTASCDIADLYLPLKSGSDVALFNGLLAYLTKHRYLNQQYIEAHTEGFDLTLATVGDFAALDQVQAATGLSAKQINDFYQLFAQTNKTVTVYSQGVNQSTSGTDKVNSIINCHLATGRVGQPGSTPFSVTGQPNAMGGREVGGLANMLASHMDFNNADHHRLISQFWQTDTLAQAPGRKAMAMFDAIEQGEIKAIWIMATNPAVSLPDNQRINKILDECPLVVVSDCMADTDTLRHAHVKLPAQGWSEKSGTVTNSERRISRQRRLLPTPGEGKPDWWIISEVAKRMGFFDAFPYQHEADIFKEYSQLTAFDNYGKTARPLNLSGLSQLSSKEYHQLSPQQWPVHNINQPTPRLLGDGQFATPSGKAQFIACQFEPPIAQPNASSPFILNTGRVRDHWHTMTRSGLSPRLSEHTNEPFVMVHPDDATRHQLTPDGIVKLSNEYGQAHFRLITSKDVQPNNLFAPFHWNDSNSNMGKVTALISPHTDPISGQPEFKHTPVAITPFASESTAILVTRIKINTQALNALPNTFWTHQTMHRGHLYRISSNALPTWLNEHLQRLLSPQTETLNHPHAKQQIITINTSDERRFAKLVAGKIEAALVISRDIQQHDTEYLFTLLGRTLNDSVVQSLFTGKTDPKQRAGRMVCVCKKIGEKAICQAIKNQQLTTVQQVAQTTQAGTGCGSCTAEIQNLLEQNPIVHTKT